MIVSYATAVTAAGGGGVQQMRSEDAEEGALEAGGCRQRLRLRNHGSCVERLPAAGGVIIVRVGFVVVQVETWSYKIVIPSKSRERRALSVTVTGAKKVSWEQNCQGGKLKRDDK